MSEVVASLNPSCLITYSVVQPAWCVLQLQELCTGIAWHLAFPAAGIAWLNFLESPPSPHLHASSPPDEQDARLRIFLLLCGKSLTSRFHIKQIEHSHECHYRTRYQSYYLVLYDIFE